MDYALIKNGAVANVIVADEEFIATIQAEWDAVINVTDLNPKPAVGWAYGEGVFTAPTEPETPAPAEPRHITVGAFFDRFGAAKWEILASTDPLVQAMVRDVSVRKFIDLDRPDLLQGLVMVQSRGLDIDPQAIVSAPVQPEEKP